MSDHAKNENEKSVVTAECTRSANVYTPRFDIVETEDELTLYGDMPGVEPEDLNIRFEDGWLTVHGKTTDRREGHERLYSEYGVGDYYREFRISDVVDASRIEAELKNGVLTLHLPKAEAVKPKRIEVKAG